MESNIKILNLKHGEEYSIAELFKTDHRKIIIPDFQRDYCWGDKNYGDKKDTDIVTSFIQTLIEEAENGDILLGKIDVYQNPSNHIYLTDGQQRLTTIYLLVGMLYRLVKNDEIKKQLKNCLISDFEINDDFEPYLQYSIRESSVFFLRDLVSDFFLGAEMIKVDEITIQSWYFNDYNLDPTIISMISALKTIEHELKKVDKIEEFSNFVINNIKIQYYDVADRKHGEERFVIINTTGKGLTPTENIKPILLGKSLNEIFSKKWEERETFFWKNRNEKSEYTSDQGVEDFLTWCFQIVEKKADVNLNKKSKEYLKENKCEPILQSIDVYFSSLNTLLQLFTCNKVLQQFKFINEKQADNHILYLRQLTNDQKLNVLIPLLYFISKNQNEEDIYQFLRRLRKNYFDLQIKERIHNHVKWETILQIIEKSNSLMECLQFNDIDESKAKWYNQEEQIKYELKKNNIKEIEQWEDYPDFMGDLTPIINLSTLVEAENFTDIVSLRNIDYNTLSKGIEVYDYLKSKREKFTWFEIFDYDYYFIHSVKKNTKFIYELDYLRLFFLLRFKNLIDDRNIDSIIDEIVKKSFMSSILNRKWRYPELDAVFNQIKLNDKIDSILKIDLTDKMEEIISFNHIYSNSSWLEFNRLCLLIYVFLNGDNEIIKNNCFLISKIEKLEDSTKEWELKNICIIPGAVRDDYNYYFEKNHLKIINSSEPVFEAIKQKLILK